MSWTGHRGLGGGLPADFPAAVRMVLEHTSDIIWLHGPDGVCEWVSPSLRTVLGYEPDSLIGTRTSVLHPDDRGSALLALQHALDRQETHHRRRVRVVTAADQVLWVDAAMDLWWQDGRLQQIVTSMRDITQQLAAEQAALRAEARFRLIAEDVGDFVFTCDLDNVIDWASPNVRDILGWEPDELAGASALDWVHPDFLAQARADGEQVKSGQPASSRSRIRAKDGGYRWMSCRLRPLRDASGHVVGQVAAVRDIAQEVAIEADLAQSATQYRVLAEHASDAVFSVGQDLVYDYVSMSVRELLGWDPADLIGQRPGGLVHPEDASRLSAAIAEVGAGNPAAIRVRLRTAAGAYRWVSSTVRPVIDSSGQVVRRVGAWSDAEDQVRAEQALAESERRYRLLADNSGDVVIATDPAGVLTYVSPAVTSVLGWQPEDLIGSPAPELAHPDDRARLTCAPDKTTETGTRRVRLRCADGSYRWVGCVSRALAEGGVQIGTVAAWRDIQAEVDAEAAVGAERARLRATMDADLDPQVFLAAVRDDSGEVVDFAGFEANPAALEFLGWDAAQFASARVSTTFPPREGSRLRAWLISALSGGQVLVTDDLAANWPPAGPERRLDLRATAVGDLISLSWRDVTERTRWVRDLADAQRHYQLLAENASDMVALTDVDVVVRWFSPSVSALGWDPQEAIGRPASEFIHPDDWDSLIRLRDACDRGERQTAQCRVRLKDGSYRWYRVRMNPVHDDDGNLTGRVTGWSDIDAERTARMALQASEDRFRRLVEGSASGLVLQAADGSIVDSNPAARTMLGRGGEELATLSSMDATWRTIHADGSPMPGNQHPAMIALATGEAVRDAVVGVHRPDNSLIWLNVTAIPIELPGVRGGTGVVTSFTDITAIIEGERLLLESEAKFRRMFTDHDAIMLLIEPEGGAIVDANKAACAYYGYAHEELCAMKITEINTLPAALVNKRRQEAARRERTSFRFQHRLADGTIRQVEVHSSPVVDANRHLLFSIIHDVTEAEAARRALGASEEKFRRVAESIGDVVATFDSRGRPRWISPSIRTVLGYAPEDLGRGERLDLIHADDLEPTYSRIRSAVAARLPSAPAFRMRVRHAGGHYVWVETVASFRYDENGELMEMFGVTRDVDQQVRAEDELARAARTDTLTGLMTRSEVVRQTAEILSHPPRRGEHLAVLFCDLDDLKSVNDSRGHAAGDLLITTTANRIAGALRSDDLVARIGGDELLVILTGVTGDDDAVAIAEMLRATVARPIAGGPGRPDLSTTVSIGVTLARPGEDVADAIARADEAMYRAKRLGGDRAIGG